MRSRFSAATIAVLAMAALACNMPEQTSTAPDSDCDRLVGAWKMTQKIVTAPDGAVIQQEDGSNTYFIKHFSKGYYTFIASDVTSGKIILSGGGRYSCSGDRLNMVTEHHSAPSMIGNEHEAKFIFEDGILMISGSFGVNSFHETYEHHDPDEALPYELKREDNSKPFG